MGDAVLTGILILGFLIGSLNGIFASLNELHQSKKDISLLNEFNITNGRRDIVVYEWWRHFIRLIGFFAFFVVGITIVVGYDITQDITTSRFIVRACLLVGMLTMTANSWVDRRSRKKAIKSTFNQ